MALDSRSRKGRIALEDHKTVCEIYAKSGFSIVETAPSQPAYIDALAVKNGTIAELLEIKVRYSGISLFELEQGVPFIIDIGKISRGAILSKALCAPFVILCYLTADKALVRWQITNYRGSEICPYDVVTLATRGNINARTRKDSLVAQLRLEHGTRIQ